MKSALETSFDPLLDAGWDYVDHPSLDDFRAADWAVLERQRGPYQADQQGAQALRLLSASRDDPSFGYACNNYRHCLQSATLAFQAGLDEEAVVVALLHDIGFIVCPTSHGAFSAALLGPYVDESHHWMLTHHALFQTHHIHEHPTIRSDLRERWRGHPHFAWTADFVARFDQNAIDPRGPFMPLEAFEPMVRRIFARPPRPLPLD